jgi:cytochrome c oxidase subunit II
MGSVIQSALSPAGIQAGHITGLWWLMFWTSVAVYVSVLVAVALAIRRGRQVDDAAPSQRNAARSVVAATTVTIVILLGLLYASVSTGRAVGSLQSAGALGIEVVGYQWWWSVRYKNPVPMLEVTTANELHLPVGRPIVITLRAFDVIHSFWVPNLHGKVDLVPGRENVITLRVDTPGVYRGQCAEYCGLQHAHMAFTVVAEESDAFERWVSGQRPVAPPPSSAEHASGLAVVERGPCAMCHTIRGTIANGRFGPDLTHVATRSTLAAGTVANTPDNLARWIKDPQHLKPGTRMPSTGLSDQELRAVVAYLQTLK